MLTIELGDTHDDENIWNFPKHLWPLSQEAEQLDQVVYDIVGRAFFSDNLQHFTARFADGQRVFDYNDMESGGRAVLNTEAKVKTQLAGLSVNDSVPSGFRTYVVVYCLRGGTKAKAHFSQNQITLAQRIHQEVQLMDVANRHFPTASIAGSNITRLPDEDRYWVKNPHSKKTSEYEFILTPASNLKHIRSQSNESQQREALAKRVRLAEDFVDTFDDALADDAVEKRLEKRLGNLGQGAWQSAFTPMPPEIEDMWLLNCRCGMEGDGHALLVDAQDIIQCDICKAWSHLACQRGGEASTLRRNQKFYCDACLPPSVMPPRTHAILYVISSALCHMLLICFFSIRKKKVVMQQKPSDPLAKRLR